MAQNSKIEWTEATWNPVRGCTKISPGCKNCYAETFAERFRGVKGSPYEQGFDLRLVPEKLDDPINRKKATTYFVNSMSDLFHESISDEYIWRVWSTMLSTPRHTYQVLTKRAERMADVVVRLVAEGLREPANIWLGTSVEDRKHGLPRIDTLRQIPAAVRFLSIEPLLEDLGEVDITGIHWVIVGGESGANARPMHPAWVRSIRDQCLAAGVPFFFKQWGQLLPTSQTLDHFNRPAIQTHLEAPNLEYFYPAGKKAAGRLLDGVEWNQYPKREKTQ